jgi:hypothetical protein
MNILAYPTPTNKLHTIGEAPSHRPLGRTGAYAFQAQPNDPTPLSCVNKKAYNSRGFTGTRATKFIQDNQFLPVDRAPGVYPLSTPGTEGLGNVGDSAPQPRPGFAQPMNGDFQNILNILNTPDNGLSGANLSAGQVRLLAERREKLTHKPEAGSSAGVQVATDFANTRKVMMKEQRIRNAEAQGFTREEAEKAYEKLRDREAEVALGTQESVASRFADLIDSRLGGVEDGQYRNNNESAKYLAYAGGKQEHRTVVQLLHGNPNYKDEAARRIQNAARVHQRVRAPFRQAVLPQIGEGVYLKRTVPFINNPLLQDTTTGKGILPRSVPRDDKSQRPQVFTNASMFLPGASTLPQREAAARVIQTGFRERPEAQEARRIASLRSDYEFRSVYSTPQQVVLPSETAARIVEAVEVKRGRGRPVGSKDKAPRERPTGIVYKKKGGGGGGAGV